MGAMVSRKVAESILKHCNYERFTIAPSLSAYRAGISIDIYATREATTHYGYGSMGEVDGYICPASYLGDLNKLGRMIGWNGSVVLLNRQGELV